MEDVKVKIGNGEVNEDQDLMENEETAMEMELTEDDLEGLEKIVEENVEKHTGSSKRQRKTKEATTENSESKNKKSVEKVDLKSSRILEREIKKGNVMCPQFRIEKADDNTYNILMAPTITTRLEDLKFDKVGNNPKLVDAKKEAAVIASKQFGDKFIHTTSDGEEIEHEVIRMELHKPGRDKDVVEVETVTGGKAYLDNMVKKQQRKAEQEATKAAKENEEKEQNDENKESV